MSAAIAAR
jgi:hypothetical protein